MADRYDLDRDRDRDRGGREDWERGRDSHREFGSERWGDRRHDDYDRDRERRTYLQSGFEGRQNRPYNEYTSDFGERGDWGRQGNWGTYGNRSEYGRDNAFRDERRFEGGRHDERNDYGRDRGNWDFNRNFQNERYSNPQNERYSNQGNQQSNQSERGDYGRNRRDEWERTGSWASGEPGRGTGSFSGAGGMGGYGSSMSYTGNIGAPVSSMHNYSGGAGSYGGGMGTYSERGRYSGRGPKGWQRSDDRLREDINERLTDHPDIDASEIEVRVNNGEVTLTGTVEQRHAKRLAEDIAENISGVKEVHNQIRVQQHASMLHGSESGQHSGSGQTGSSQSGYGAGQTGSGSNTSTQQGSTPGQTPTKTR
jgi:osmotically-inducible protein OsmY